MDADAGIDPRLLPFPRADLPTPALVLDRTALERNIAKMAAFAAARGLALRPHAKTHKCGEIARRQIAAGAVGVCCAKLGEAEALAADGVDDLHLTSPVVTRGGDRAAGRAERAELRAVGGGRSSGQCRGAGRGGGGGKPLAVFVDVDPGIHRTGVASPEAAVELAQAIAAAAELTYAGVQFYCGRTSISDFASGGRRSRSDRLSADGARRAHGRGTNPGRHRRRHRHAIYRCRARRVHRAAGRLLCLHRPRI